GAIARCRVFGDERTAAGRRIEVEEVAGKVLTGIELEVVLQTTLGDLQHIAGEQIGASSRVEGNPGEVERVAGQEARDRVARHAGAVDLQAATSTRKRDCTAGRAADRQLQGADGYVCRTANAAGLAPLGAGVDRGSARRAVYVLD